MRLAPGITSSVAEPLTRRVPDAPKADEIALVLVMSCGPRVHARVGGLKAADIKGEDGLR